VAGSICLGATGGAECVPFCSTDADCTMAGSICAGQIANSNTGNLIPNVNTCSAPCDPVANTFCPAGTTCRPAYNTTQNRAYTLCDPTGDKGAGRSCYEQEQCEAQYGCEGNGDCLQYCYVGGSTCNDCEAVMVGNNNNVPVVINGMTLGYCP